MSIRTLSPDQQQAIDKAKDWWQGEKEHPFVLTGAAGTGKTTVVEEILSALNIPEDEALMVANAATAVKNIQSKNPMAMAATIASIIKGPANYYIIYNENHEYIIYSLDSYMPKFIQNIFKAYIDDKIYDDIFDIPVDILAENLAEHAYQIIRDVRFMASPTAAQRYTIPWKIQYENFKANNSKKATKEWLLEHPEHKMPQIMVVDEVGMVSNQDMRLLKEVGFPILATGDPNQLPPIDMDGDSQILKQVEDHAELTQIHRQSKDSQLLVIANAAKNGENWLKMAEEDTQKGVRDVFYNPFENLPISIYTQADMILATTNRTVKNYNEVMHQQHGHEPLYIGEPLLINYNTKVKDDYGAPLLANGQIVYVTTIHRHNDSYYDIDVEDRVDPDNIKTIHHIVIDASNLADPKQTPATMMNTSEGANRLQGSHLPSFWVEFDQAEVQEVIYASYGYAMTIHKAQGKEWDRVILNSYLPPMMQANSKELMYTAITRARQKLVII